MLDAILVGNDSEASAETAEVIASSRNNISESLPLKRCENGRSPDPRTELAGDQATR
jgi:hypothetical protein